MTNEERLELILAFARVLYVNGQATDQVIAASRRLGNKLGVRAELLPRWGELQLRAEGEGASSHVAADPTGVDMDRVVSTMQAVGLVPSPKRRRRRHGCLPWPPLSGRSRWRLSSAFNTSSPLW